MRTLTTCSFLNNIGDCPQSIDSPLQLKLINFLGLKNYMIDNFIFRRKPSKYHIRKKQQCPQLFLQQKQYEPPTGYTKSIHIIETSGNSIPICRLIPKHRTNNCVIVYAHGNGSDLSDSIAFVDRLSQFIHAEYVMFDYTGYGESRVPDVGEEVICRDLQIVLAWLSSSVSMRDVVLWGFSLGTYPVVATAAKYPVSAIILQCPIASISCLFHTQLQPDMKFKQDHFANIDYIGQVHPNTKILIMHSADDQIIPFSHAKILYTKYLMKHGSSHIDFIEIAKIRHNSLHKYIVSPIQNQLQTEVFSFLTQLIYASHNNHHHNTQHNNHHNTSMESTGSLNSSNSIILKQQPQKPSSTLTLTLSQPPTKQAQQREKVSKIGLQLQQLRMQIIESQIEQIPGDMHELIVEEEMAKDKKTKIQKVKEKILESRAKNCFCFQNKL